MKPDEMIKELWSIANIITGFAVAQSLAFALALGKDLEKLERQTSAFKISISCIASTFAALYCLAVWQCWTLASSLDSQLEHDDIWHQVTIGRTVCILLFTAVPVFGLFARNIFKRKK